MKNPIWVDGQKSIQKQSTWQERLNKQFFSGIPMDEMGSNQVEESELHGFILSEREALLREIMGEIGGMKLLRANSRTEEKYGLKPIDIEYISALTEVQELIEKKI